jgi:Xaa-Pro aminopeptidase
MAVIEQTVSLSPSTVAAIQEELRRTGTDGWLLYDFHGLNPIASGLLGLPAMTRRFFVLIPASGPPVALTHRIEQQPWRGWIGEQRVYLAWQELEAQLADMLRGVRRVALEYAPGDVVPYLDRVPAGVVERVRAAGVETVSSAELISAFYARWSAAGEASHRRAAATLQRIARAAFARMGKELRRGESPTEWTIREWIRAEQESAGLRVGCDAIVAVGANAANPHYGPTRDEHAPIRPGDLVLIDLWGKEAPDSIFADQTWMGYLGDAVPDRLQRIWEAVRDARDAAVRRVGERWAAGEPVAGWEIDDAAREVIAARGWGPHFIHRTGHSIDRELHGSGPNLDNLETRDTRRLLPGLGFSVEPGIYLDGDVGFRSEVAVFMAPGGPEVTTPEPQRELIRVPVSLP